MDRYDATDACGTKPECTACPGPGRREFLRESVVLGAAFFVALGLSPSAAAGLPVRRVMGMRSGRELTLDLPAGDGAVVDRDDEVILMRQGDLLYAFALSCPHQHTMLKWLEKEGRFQCSKHKSKYQPDGNFISGRATRGMDRYRVRVENGQAVVDLSTAIHQDEDSAAWEAAFTRIP